MTDANAPERARTDRGGWGFTTAVGVLLLVAGVFAMPTAIQAGDAGEFATVMLQGGIPHPSGYPWMRIFGAVARGLRALGVDAVPAAAAVGMLGGVAGWVLLHRVAMHWLRRGSDDTTQTGLSPRAAGITAGFAVALCALSPPVMLHVNDSEVWGPLILFASVVLWLAVVRRSSPFVLGLGLGLALSHHLTAALLLPVCVAGAWPPQAPTLAGLLRRAAAGVAGGVCGLLPYATLALGDGDAWRWGDPSSVQGLLHHVSRADYGVLSLSLQQTSPPAWAQLSRAASSVGGSASAGLLSTPWLAGALVVVVMVVALRSPHGRRRDRIGVVSAAAASVWLFPLAHNIDPSNDFGAWILERFDILGLALLAPLLALSLARPVAAVASRGRAAGGLAVAGGLLLLRQGLVAAWHGLPASNPDIERYAVDVLSTPPEGPAIVIGTDDHRLFPITFVQEVRGLRPDVTYVDASLLSHPWYRAHLRRRFPTLPDVDKPVALLSTLWSDPRWADLPVYLTNDFSRPSRALARVPEGILWRVIPPTQESSPQFDADSVLARHRAALSRYGAPSTDPLVAGHPFAGDLRATYTEGTAALAQALRAQGRPDDAEALLRFAIRP